MPDYPSSYDAFVETANGRPDDVALLTEGKADTTFGELNEHIKLNRRVLATWGVARDTRFAFLVNSRDTMLVAFMSAISCGVAVSLNPEASDDEILADLVDCRIDYLIIEDGAEDRLFQIAKRAGIPVIVVAPDSSKTGYVQFDRGPVVGAGDPALPRPDDLAILQFSSGTTARKKILPFKQSRMVATTRMPENIRWLSPPGRCLNVMPLHHGQGLWGEGIHPLLTGSSVYIANFDPRRFVDQVLNAQASWFALVPSMHLAVIEATSGRENVFAGSNLRFCKSTSAALPSTLRQGMNRVYGVPIFQAYGCPEASTIAMTEFDDSLNKPGSVGKSSRDDIDILDNDGSKLPPGVSGEICAKVGPRIFGGYENNPEANAEAFRDGYFHTGDGGYFDEDGYLFLTGRVRENINRGGEKISPSEVDDVLLNHPAIANAAAFAAPSERMGEEVMAAVVLKSGHNVSLEEVRNFAAQKLSFAKVPKRVFIVDELPLNASGKLMRRDLASRLLPDA